MKLKPLEIYNLVSFTHHALAFFRRNVKYDQGEIGPNKVDKFN